MKTEYPADALKYQWRIMRLVTRSVWATGLDKSVAFEIIDNYRKEFRNSRTSLSYLMTATGADRKAIIASTRRLVENGPFHVIRQGAGTRPTEYGIKFDLVADKPSGGTDTTTTEPSASSGVETTTASGVETTTSAASSGVQTTESDLPVFGLQADIQDREIYDCAPATPPLADGLRATAAGGAQDGFEELWRAYGYRKAKADARTAYRKLAPGAELHAELVSSANRWQASWAAQGKAEAPRFTLAKWLEREEFDCDPPTGYQAKTKPMKAAAVRPPPAANDDKPAEVPEWLRGRPQTWPPGRYIGEFVEGDVKVDGKDTEVTMKYEIADGPRKGERLEHRFFIESHIKTAQDEGQVVFTNICKAAGLDSVEDTEELLFRPLRAVANGKTVTYSSIEKVAA